MSNFISNLIARGYLKTDSLVDAFLKVKRKDFVLPEFVRDSEEDIALPIGYGQTISQPLTVAFMLELLDPRAEQKILDVGSGSGWTTALLAHVVGEKGEVKALEVIEELVELGKKNTSKYNFVERGIAEFYLADGWKGLPEEAPYDRILVSASASCIPNNLKEQLKIGGKMVIPVGNSIWQMEKKGGNEFEKREYEGFVFVPLIEKKIPNIK